VTEFEHQFPRVEAHDFKEFLRSAPARDALEIDRAAEPGRLVDLPTDPPPT
jgi:hypothetical protein